jgi:putative transposase
MPAKASRRKKRSCYSCLLPSRAVFAKPSRRGGRRSTWSSRRRSRRARSGRCRRSCGRRPRTRPARAPVRERFPDFAQLLAAEPDADAFARLRAAESVGRPLGDDRFLARLERTTRRGLKPRKRGPKPRTEADEAGEQLNALSP